MFQEIFVALDGSPASPVPIMNVLNGGKRAELRGSLAEEGAVNPDRAAEVLLHRGVNYESDNLVFASVYAAFLSAALSLAVLCLTLWAWRLRRPRVRPSLHP